MTVQPGGVWESRRAPGRTVVVERIGFRHVIVRVLTNTAAAQAALDAGEAGPLTDVRGRRTRMLASSLHSYYRPVTVVTRPDQIQDT